MTKLSAQHGIRPAAKEDLLRGLASKIGSPDAQRREPEASIAGELAGDETYSCLLAIPRIGPKTATRLVTLVYVPLIAGDDRLTIYCRLAPADQQSGTSLSSTSTSRSDKKTPENLLISTRGSVIGMMNRFGGTMSSAGRGACRTTRP